MGLGQGDRGYAMAALLVGMSIMAVMMSVAMPVWTHFNKREKEEELIWRGQQYARAIGLFQRKFANTFPPNVDILVEQKFLRKKYKDPITGEDFQPIPATGMVGGGIFAPPGSAVIPGVQNPAGAGRQSATPMPPQQPRTAGPPARMTSQGTTMQAGVGIQGVVSKSTDTSIKVYNGRTKYNEWAFVYMVSAQRIQPGGQLPGNGPVGPDGQPQGGTTFTPLGVAPRRPGVGGPTQPGTTMPGARPGQAPPFGQPSPFGRSSPFGQPQPQPPQPTRPPGN